MYRLKSLAYCILPNAFVQAMRRRRWYRMFVESANSEPEQAILHQFVKAGDSVMDVGANLGSYTRAFSLLVGASGNVYSLEPVPYTFEVLKHNVERAGLRNVHLLHNAVSSTDHDLIMQVPRFDSGGESYYEAHVTDNPDPALAQIKVRAKTLDSIHAEIGQPRIAFIKCDIEGHELECLHGATKLIGHSHPTWLIEIKGDPEDAQSQAYQTFKLLREANYRVYILENNQIRERRPGETSLNYFFVANL